VGVECVIQRSLAKKIQWALGEGITVSREIPSCQSLVEDVQEVVALFRTCALASRIGGEQTRTLKLKEELTLSRYAPPQLATL
jgi:hypothetical protein